jgi:hypothetical protein
MAEESGTGDWRVEPNGENNAVIITLTHMGEDGVESFKTALPPEYAVEFAKAVVEMATWIVDNAE